MLKKHSILLALLMLTGGTALFAGTVSGKITDSKGKAMAGIPVSDGISVVTTGDDGAYKLELRDGQPFVFIQNPDGYYAEEWFVRKPESGKKYNFTLKARKLASPRRFIQFADTEIRKMEWAKIYRKPGADFIIHTGDIAGEEAAKIHIKDLNFKTHGLPVYYAIGNHDIPDATEDKEYYEKYIQPYYYSFCWDKYLMIVAPMWRGDGKPSYSMADFAEWLEKVMAVNSDKKIIVLCHDFFKSDINDRKYYKHDGKAVETGDRIAAWVVGHHHTNVALTLPDGAKYFCVSPPMKGGIDHSFSAIRELRINKDGELESELIWGSNGRGVHLALPVNGLTLERDGKNVISATAWHQVHPVTGISVAIGDAKPVELKKVGGSWIGETDEKDPGSKIIKVSARLRNGKKMNRTYPPQDKEAMPSIKLCWMSNMESQAYATSPVVAEGKVFTSTIDANSGTRGGVYAWDAATGKLLWKFLECGPVPGQIEYSNGVLYFMSTGADVYAVSAADGKVIWKDKNPLVAYQKPSGTLLEDGVFYGGSRKRFTAYDAATGKVIWRADGWERGGASGLNKIVKTGNMIIVTYNWHGVMGFDAATGKMKWFTKDRQIRFASSGALIHNGKVYMKGGREIIVLDPVSGKVLKRRDLRISTQSMSVPVVIDGILVFGNRDCVLGLDPDTLAYRWVNKTINRALVDSVGYAMGAKSVESTIIKWRGKLWFGANDGNIYALDPRTGKTVERIPVGAPIISRMTADGDRIYMTDFTGRVYCFTAR